MIVGVRVFAAEVPEISLRPALSGLSEPVYVTHAGDGSGRLFVVEQAGRVLVARDGALLERPFLDIRDRVSAGGETGLLGLAFHPSFRSSGRFFVDYTGRRDRQLTTVIAEFRVSPDSSDVALAEERVLLEITQPYPNHNGGQIAFGPDGFLYIGMGDGGSAGDPHGHGQHLESLLGKILRIDVDGPPPYACPPDNPFVDQPGADEIWAYGLRNPWRFSFDRGTGRLFAADVGQDRYEEIDLIQLGGNYGWNRMEGLHCFPPSRERCERQGLIEPIAEYDHQDGVSVTGGYVYRGGLLPALQGGYIFGDFGSAQIWLLREAEAGRWERVALRRSPQPISSFGEDEAGEVYVVGYGGTVFRIEPAAPPQPRQEPEQGGERTHE